MINNFNHCSQKQNCLQGTLFNVADLNKSREGPCQLRLT